MEEGFGRTVSDTKMEAEGAINKMTGAAQNMYGQVKDAAGQAVDSAGDAARAVRDQLPPMERAIRHSIENSPYTAVTIAFGIALGIGWLLGRSSSDYRAGGYPWSGYR
jgi:uncharacterized protein YjbJ (UPF0337 family)